MSPHLLFKALGFERKFAVCRAFNPREYMNHATVEFAFGDCVSCPANDHLFLS